ncbi:hypothetical protein LBW59_13420 [Ralstonia solanacearum]|uniref:Uncharacterized protein n=1 Tax=Ralstonia solanacearum TaxID=305 RepID=A0AAW5ZMW2_RALSL|nr:hypothetical protein [Ralstonia solanacearum]MDB0571765.1 hypothetical protein [Ralstonia solanacearum]
MTRRQRESSFLQPTWIGKMWKRTSRSSSSSTSTTTPNLERQDSLEKLDTAIANLQDERRQAIARNPALALLEPRSKNTNILLNQASALSADRRRDAGNPKNDATPISKALIDALNNTAESWIKA